MDLFELCARLEFLIYCVVVLKYAVGLCGAFLTVCFVRAILFGIRMCGSGRSCISLFLTLLLIWGSWGTGEQRLFGGFHSEVFCV